MALTRDEKNIMPGKAITARSTVLPGEGGKVRIIKKYLAGK